MKLKRYDQYINEDLTPDRINGLSLDDEMEIPAEETGAEETGAEETGDVDVTPMNTDAEVAMDEEPEEEYEFQGEKMLQELANRLGSEVENNMINYNVKKIEFYSETEAFAIDRKGKYKTVDEVISKLEQ
jgi:hypothetical protein